MNNSVGLLIAAVGGYFLYEWLHQKSALASIGEQQRIQIEALNAAGNPILACHHAGGIWDTSGIVSGCVMPATSPASGPVGVATSIQPTQGQIAATAINSTMRMPSTPIMPGTVVMF